MGVTIKDVAKAAGVSHTTVSMVIHNDRRITPETKAKVEKAIKELNYHPNYLARGLVRGKSNTIAVVATLFSSVFDNNILKGIESSDADPNYNINHYSTRGREDAKNQILKNILYGKMADAVIVVSMSLEREIVEEYLSNEIPMIIIEEKSEGVHSLTVNNYQGAYTAAKHMLEKGMKDPAIIIGSGVGEQGNSPKERLDGFKACLKDNNIELNDSNIYFVEKFDFDDGVEGVKKLLQSDGNIDGIFCASGDLSAMGAIKQLQAYGKNVPNDVMVVGYDDIDFAALVNPALTTIRQPIKAMGEEAYKIAIEAAKGKIKEPKDIVFETELVVRGTT